VIDVSRAFLDLDLAELQRRKGANWSRYPAEILPAWVADMDYPLAPCIEDALIDAVRRGDVGYPPMNTAVADAFMARAKARWNWTVAAERVYLMPDVVQAIEVLIERFSASGDGILVTTPVYPPFLNVTDGLHRRIIESPLQPDGSLDPENLKAVFAKERPRIVLLCSPHNPMGRVFRRAELELITSLALEHQALIISDEIHAELVFPGRTHTPTASLSKEVAAATITVTSASKPFNIAGLRCAQVISGSAELHGRVTGHADIAKEPLGTLAIAATLAAWTPAGDEWLAACLAQIEANMRRVAAWAAIHNIGFQLPEATYLAWLDFRSVELGPQPQQWLLHHAHVALSPGTDFGRPGHGFARLNVATSPAILDLILERISDALAER
jgi:cysteine-S-conjugate beta-lyase